MFTIWDITIEAFGKITRGLGTRNWLQNIYEVNGYEISSTTHSLHDISAYRQE